MSIIKKRPKTKIVCTLGPATASPEMVRTLIEAGMSVARLNMSHGTLEQHRSAALMVREASKAMGSPVGLMVDVPGPKYRTGPVSTGFIEVRPGDRLTLTSRAISGTPQAVGVTPPGIHRDAAVGGRVLLDDGRIELKVLHVEGDDVQCEAVTGGRLTEGRGVATPGKAPSQPVPDDKAIRAIEFAAKEQADFVALSTVTSASDVYMARQLLKDRGLVNPFIISKIERAEAIGKFQEILAASDAIMVARGDMGVEVRLAEVPVIQKRLITQSNIAGKPVITATQMLESMVLSPVPTRAEVTDVANAVFDGSDAIMLSGETSIGRHPIEAVKVMTEVALEAEAALPYDIILVEKRRQLEQQTDDAIAYDACQTAHQLRASLIIAFTESGSTAGRVSKYRPQSPVLALTPSALTQRRLSLRWGVTPVVIKEPNSVDDVFTMGEESALRMPGVVHGNLVVLVAGLPIGVPGGTNLLRVLTVGQKAPGAN
ncbi:MAG: pyruvate kinase [SAR202 cluster bacterium]|nr:pyruvate kinase [SAR202 cluster bacterium]